MRLRFSALMFGVSAGLFIPLLCSCAIRRNAGEPPVELSSGFSYSGAQDLPACWWKSFGDPKLDVVIEKVLSGSFSLRAARARLEQARAVARKQGAGLFPSVNLEAAVTDRKEEKKGESEEAALSVREFAAGGAVSYELDLWGRVRSLRDAARLDAEATAEQLQAAAMTLSAEAGSLWYQLVEQNGQIRLLKRQLALNEEMLVLVELQFRQGQTASSDVLRQKQVVESRRGDMAGAEARAAVIGNALAVLAGQEAGRQVFEEESVFPVFAPMPATGLPVDLIRRRPDLRRSYYALCAADKRAAAAVADRFPKISLSARMSSSGEDAGVLFENWLTALAANIAMPILDAGARRAESARTKAVAAEMFNAYGHDVLNAVREVEDALVQEAKQGVLVDSLRKQVEIAGLAVELARDNYRSGAGDYMRVIDALLTHQSLERERLQAERQRLQYRINLCRALGGGWLDEAGAAVGKYGDKNE